MPRLCRWGAGQCIKFDIAPTAPLPPLLKLYQLIISCPKAAAWDEGYHGGFGFAKTAAWQHLWSTGKADLIVLQINPTKNCWKSHGQKFGLQLNKSKQTFMEVKVAQR